MCGILSPVCLKSKNLKAHHLLGASMALLESFSFHCHTENYEQEKHNIHDQEKIVSYTASHLLLFKPPSYVLTHSIFQQSSEIGLCKWENKGTEKLSDLSKLLYYFIQHIYVWDFKAFLCVILPTQGPQIGCRQYISPTRYKVINIIRMRQSLEEVQNETGSLRNSFMKGHLSWTRKSR